jgi:inner membrane protein
MASALSHAAVALAAGTCFPRDELPRRAILVSVILAVLPDIDAVGYWLGVPTSALLGHRGLTHSLLFAAALGTVAALVYSRGPESVRDRRLLVFFFVLVTALHGVLDGFTNGGPGIAYFSPLGNERYFFPFRPIEVSPIGFGVLNARGLRILLSETRWVLLPSAALMAGVTLLRRPRRRDTRQQRT